MGSITELTWAGAMELFVDLDLDDLFIKQLEVLGGHSDYPYVLLVNTGRYTLGINLGPEVSGTEEYIFDDPEPEMMGNFVPYLGSLSEEELNDSTFQDTFELNNIGLIKPKKESKQ